MRIFDLPNDEEVQIVFNGGVYDLKILQKEDEDLNTRCGEWCALYEYCNQTLSPRQFCQPFVSMYISHVERMHNMELTFQVGK